MKLSANKQIGNNENIVIVPKFFYDTSSPRLLQKLGNRILTVSQGAGYLLYHKSNV